MSDKCKHELPKLKPRTDIVETTVFDGRKTYTMRTFECICGVLVKISNPKISRDR